MYFIKLLYNKEVGSHLFSTPSSFLHHHLKTPLSLRKQGAFTRWSEFQNVRVTPPTNSMITYINYPLKNK